MTPDGGDPVRFGVGVAALLSSYDNDLSAEQIEELISEIGSNASSTNNNSDFWLESLVTSLGDQEIQKNNHSISQDFIKPISIEEESNRLYSINNREVISDISSDNLSIAFESDAKDNHTRT